MCVRMNLVSDSSFSSALVCWYRNVLFADPPPLVMNRKLYLLPCVAYKSICAGRFVPEFFSSVIVNGTTCE